MAAGPSGSSWNWRLPIIAFVGAGAGTYVVSVGLPALTLPKAINPTCSIKGNISINTGERIYHMPGDKFYSETIIRPEYGEKWFCSEYEAMAAGWRRARR
ncbi:sunset domain-containing protein [Mesorhizobium sp. Cs1321R2N1]|uniref:sunset domain-containing protein n=1 Tax=Mesorhizobium sp. Cs1321R2N1 TaxID=3015174 RepID=UPI00301E1061